jgi:hypothetical protein
MNTKTAGSGASAQGQGLKPTVALSIDFLSQAAKLPSAAHAKVLKWAMGFQNDPTSTGINYETIHSRDPNLRSVRIDQDWRGIVHKPDKGSVYTLLYVDRHDDAYAWAKNRKVAINRVTGAMQLVTLEALQEVVDTTASQAVPVAKAGGTMMSVAAAGSTPSAALGGSSGGLSAGSTPVLPWAARDAGISAPEGDAVSAAVAELIASVDALAAAPWTPFVDLTDFELLSLGVPEDWLVRVRAIASEQALDALQASLPVEAYEGLFLVGAGDTVDTVLNARETRVDRTIDVEDFEAALKTPESQARFVIVADDTTMAAMLNAPLAQWRVFLHPTQHKLAQGGRSGPVRVLGGAGTGKTVLAMHRAKWLAEHATAPGRKVLFTTFTRNLAKDIEDNLRSLCTPSTMDRIEVRNLDAWVWGFLRSRRYPQRIVYDRQEDSAAKAAWQTALALRDTTLDLPEGFYEEELEAVVLAQGVTTRDEYRTVRRTGRGVVLNRGKRDAVWPVFEEYRRQMASRQLKEVDDAYREIAQVLAKEADDARAANKDWKGLYPSIVIDETQDFGPQALKLLRSMVPPTPNDLFFVGDGHQRIYPRNRAAMGRCGIDIRGRSRKLYLNYRTTAEIRNQAVALLEGVDVDDLDDSHDELRRYKSLSHGPKPTVHKAETTEAAVTAVVEALAAWRRRDTEDPDPSGHVPTMAALARTARLRDEIGRRCAEIGLSCVVVDKDQGADMQPGVIRLATLHRAKGLEFDRVAVLGQASALGAAEDTAQERSLLYVALTRARREAAMVFF